MSSLRTSTPFALLAAAACASVLPKSAKSDFYVLSAVEPAPASPPPATAGPARAVLLGPVVLPPYLDRRELVTRVANNQLVVEDLELWAEPLRDSVPGTIERDLAALLADCHIKRLPWSDPLPPELMISVELRRFEKTSNRTVELEARWTIADGRGGVRQQRTTRLSLPVAAPNTDAAVATMSQALATLSREIANDLRPLYSSVASSSAR